MTLYEADSATFISLRAGGGTFWYNQVEAIDSLFTVVIYSALRDLFWVIKIEEKQQSFYVLQRSAKLSLYLQIRGDEKTYCEPIMSKCFYKYTLSFRGTMQLNL